ncbi:MAG: hypothetical protein CM15mP93_16370 [Thiotrichaceae bacterium]|nr:MAG: hypothetical protein CM15mP93_16370 [Thiotrichaceae bacterium]
MIEKGVVGPNGWENQIHDAVKWGWGTHQSIKGGTWV